MRVTALVLGVIGGVVGLSCGSLAVQAGAQLNSLSRLLGTSTLEGAFGGQQLIGGGVLAVLVSLVGIVGGGIALGRPRTGATLMFVAAVTGVMLLRADYLLAAGLLVSAGILALAAPRPQQLAGATASPGLVGGGAPPTLGGSADSEVPPAAGVQTHERQGLKSIAVAAWGIAVVLVVVTWWFWVFALFGLLLLAALAWIPRYGHICLDWTGWSRLPIVGKVQGWRASGLLFMLAVVVLLAGASVSPRPPGS